MVDYTWDQGEGDFVRFSYFMYVTLMLPSRLILLDINALFQMVLDSLRVAVDIF